MTQDEADPQPSPPDGDALQAEARPRRRAFRLAVFGVFCVVALALLMAWLTRKQIADEIISGQLEKMDLPATYTVESIGPDAEVLRNLVIGDPARPDFTAERVRVAIVPRWGMPDVGRITLEKPRLYGSYRGGKFSFGSLDKVLFTGSKEPFRLPDLDVAVVDGRGRLESDYGPVGIKLEGSGRLRGGFSGVLAAVAPQAAYGDCNAEGASLFGKLTVKAEKPHFAGPLRLGSLACSKQQLRLAKAAVGLDVTLDPRLDGAEGKVDLASGALGLGDQRAASTSGNARFAWRGQALTADYEFDAAGIATPQAALGALGVSGALRGQDNFARIEITGDATGSGLRVGKGLDNALVSAGEAAKNTFAAPLLAQLRGALLREGQMSRFTASFIHRQTGASANLVVPQAALIGRSGQTLLALSKLQLSAGGSAAPKLSGNFATGGAGIPRISGRMESGAVGALAMRLAMQEYAVGTSRLAMPELVLAQSSNGALGFAGSVRLSGPLPGGAASNLALPIAGNWSQARGLAVWRKCVPVSFDSLALANLTLRKRSLTLCPQPGGAILASDARGTRLAAGTSALDLSGMLGATPIRITGGAAGFAWPGALAMRSVDVALGDPRDPSRFRIANLAARIGKDVAGRFTGGNVSLAEVPLDVLDGSGAWRFADGRLTLSDVAFRLEDRELDDRFQPLVSAGASLLLGNNRITAQAVMREPQSQRALVRADIRHDLGSGIGRADLTMDELSFDQKLQPDMISRLILGVVANAEGKVRGTGQIDWSPTVTSSSGRFTTDGLDFAAAFGPVKGASGSVEFTDLLTLVTAPDQKLKIASVNPGIEVNDGELRFELRPGNVLAVLGARWPFLDGTLTLEPTQMQLGAAETRRYTLRIDGLDAAKFVERMDMGNISATGIFDGVMPIVFDENGGRLDGGLLVSRPPGGNVSYVGALTYKDLSAMANFAFDALKSLNYRRMQIDLSGPLEGEIVTRVSFDGIGQGAGARRNFLTKRISRLPIKFNVNLKAPFFKLVGSLRSLYDPGAVRDPRELGLIGSDGKPLQNAPAPGVQPPVSEKGL